MQKVINVSSRMDGNSINHLNSWLDKGWRVVSTVPFNSARSGGESFYTTMFVVIEKDNTEGGKDGEF